MQSAAGAGATVVVLTDDRDGPVAAYADHVLLLAHDGPGIFRSLTGGLALAQALVGLVAVGIGAPADDRVARAEAHLDGFRTLLDGPAQRRSIAPRGSRKDRSTSKPGAITGRQGGVDDG